MKTICAVLALGGLLIVPPLSASAGPPPRQKIEIDPRGAVLCTWMIYTGLYEIGERCFPDEDRELLAILDAGIGRIEDFIVRNSDDTEASIAQKRSRYIAGRRQMTSRESACAPDGGSVEFYRPLRDDFNRIGRDAFRLQMEKGLDEHLAVDRKPVANPCL